MMWCEWFRYYLNNIVCLKLQQLLFLIQQTSEIWIKLNALHSCSSSIATKIFTFLFRITEHKSIFQKCMPIAHISEESIFSSIKLKQEKCDYKIHQIYSIHILHIYELNFNYNWYLRFLAEMKILEKSDSYVEMDTTLGILFYSSILE